MWSEIKLLCANLSYMGLTTVNLWPFFISWYWALKYCAQVHSLHVLYLLLLHFNILQTRKSFLACCWLVLNNIFTLLHVRLTTVRLQSFSFQLSYYCWDHFLSYILISYSCAYQVCVVISFFLPEKYNTKQKTLMHLISVSVLFPTYRYGCFVLFVCSLFVTCALLLVKGVYGVQNFLSLYINMSFLNFS